MSKTANPSNTVSPYLELGNKIFSHESHEYHELLGFLLFVPFV
ncbi:hypothetical protein BH10ACI2_BH10ACI2_16670 [soil metagenome]